MSRGQRRVGRIGGLEEKIEEGGRRVSEWSFSSLTTRRMSFFKWKAGSKFLVKKYVGQFLIWIQIRDWNLNSNLDPKLTRARSGFGSATPVAPQSTVVRQAPFTSRAITHQALLHIKCCRASKGCHIMGQKEEGTDPYLGPDRSDKIRGDPDHKHYKHKYIDEILAESFVHSTVFFFFSVVGPAHSSKVDVKARLRSTFLSGKKTCTCSLRGPFTSFQAMSSWSPCTSGNLSRIRCNPTTT